MSPDQELQTFKNALRHAMLSGQRSRSGLERELREGNGKPAYQQAIREVLAEHPPHRTPPA